jgi:uncharacterized protein YggE
MGVMKTTEAYSAAETAIVVILFVAVAAAFTYFVFSPTPQEVPVSATGVSQIKATPDLIGVYYSIETNGTTAAIAGEKNAKISDDLITALLKLGFERKDIETQGYSVNPEYVYDYRHGTQEFVGYRASHQIIIKFPTTNTHLIGDAIDAGINSGATITYINFELSITKQNEYKTEALKQATEDARLKAQAMAIGSGKTLGRLISISSSEFNYYPYRMYDTITSANAPVAKMEATSIQPSTQEVTAQVSVTFALV